MLRSRPDSRASPEPVPGGGLGVSSFGVPRKVLPGPDGLRLLAIGGTPGEAYETGGTL